MTALMLVFALTACGGRDSSAAGTNDRPAAGESSNDTAGTNTDRNDSALGNAADDAITGMENAVDDILPGSGNDTASGQDSAPPDQGGVTYGDMLENGTVEDAPTPSERSRMR